jgi:hypothetical protein
MLLDLKGSSGQGSPANDFMCRLQISVASLKFAATFSGIWQRNSWTLIITFFLTEAIS